MESQTSSGKLSDVLYKMRPYLLMICLQFGSAGNYIISMVTLNHGMNRYVLIVYRNAIAALVLAPFALIFERKTRPKITLPIFFQIIALGFLEPVLDQGFSYLGMQYTTTAYTSAIMNAVPSVTFVIAVILRLEHIRIKEIRSIAKVVGTMVTFGGALLMALYKGTLLNLFKSASSQHDNAADSAAKHYVSGTLLILLGCVAWSAFYVLQSITLKKYPAELSLSTLICLSGTIQSSAVALAVVRHPSAWAVGWDSRLLAPVYTGVVTSGITYYVQSIVMKSRGPVFVTAFNPLCMIIVAILGSLILAEKIYLGSVIGGMIIAVGLYAVVWGKGKDYPELTEKEIAQQELPITSTNINANNNDKLFISGISINDAK